MRARLADVRHLVQAPRVDRRARIRRHALVRGDVHVVAVVAVGDLVDGDRGAAVEAVADEPVDVRRDDEAEDRRVDANELGLRDARDAPSRVPLVDARDADASSVLRARRELREERGEDARGGLTRREEHLHGRWPLPRLGRGARGPEWRGGAARAPGPVRVPAHRAREGPAVRTCRLDAHPGPRRLVRRVPRRGLR